MDQNTYLVPPGSADIFFPTNFAQLAPLYRHAVQSAQPAYTGVKAPAPGKPLLTRWLLQFLKKGFRRTSLLAVLFGS